MLARVLPIAALAALVVAAAPAAGAVIPIRGAYSGTTTAGESFSMVVSTKKTGPRLRPKVKRTARVSFVTGAVPVSCNSGPAHSEEVHFPGPLRVKRNGRFAVTGVAESGSGRVTTKAAGRFTGRRTASGTLSYRGGFAGEFCSGAIAWTATRE